VLGASIVLFAAGSILLGYRIYAPAKVLQSPQDPVVPHSDAEAVPPPTVRVAPQPEAKVVPLPEAKTPPPSQTRATPSQDIKSAPPPQANPDIAKLMNTTLGDLLLAACLKDPEGAGRIVAQAIVQAEGGMSPNKVQASA